DSDADSDADTDADCDPGDEICIDNAVYLCNEDGEPELVEECEPPLICNKGMCVEDNECGEAMANHSNIGCEYWAVESDISTVAQDQPYAVVVSNLDEIETVHVVIEARVGVDFATVTEVDVAPKSVHPFLLTGGEIDLPIKLEGQHGSYLKTGQAYRVTSDLPVAAYQFTPYAGLAGDDSTICTADGTLLLASSGLDKHYYVLGYPRTAGDSSMNVIAIEDDTVVSVIPASSTLAGEGVSALGAGVEQSFTMDAADVLQLNTTADVSGTYVEADKPVVVFGGNVSSNVPNGVTFADHMEHQMFPLSTWGTTFVAARSVIRNLTTAEDDYYRILAQQDGTAITYSPEVAGAPAVLDAGEFAEFSANYSFEIAADQPILVGQYLTGYEATGLPFDSPNGDPAFALLPPVDQFLSSYVFLAPDKYPVDYAIITHPLRLEVLLDGDPVTANPDCAVEDLSAEWEITRCLIDDFGHTVDADEGVGITVWGYGGRIAYGYTGGLNLEEINPVNPE
ncbi:MAG: hypothetical protein JRF63_03430, partial [Deltaproteobacteria bacterium]|nr:hypothetical protein [Deltaproteobacteria bacterium]